MTNRILDKKHDVFGTNTTSAIDPMLLILKNVLKLLKSFVSSFPDLIGESRERYWIIRSSQIMTTIGTEFAMNNTGYI